jgi:hypothetical protein
MHIERENMVFALDTRCPVRSAMCCSNGITLDRWEPLLRPTVESGCSGRNCDVSALGLRSVFFANGREGAYFPDISDDGDGDVRTTRGIADVFGQEFFPAIGSSEARLDGYARNGSTAFEDSLYNSFDELGWLMQSVA